MFHPFEYAGPTRIPPPKLQLRVRREVSVQDTMNARHFEQWQTDAPNQQNVPWNSESSAPQKGKSELPFYDMAPLSSRTEKRDYRQSQPYIATGPSLAKNPFFDRYDPTRDPRNMIREVRSAVYEEKDSDRGLEESKRLLARGLTSRWIPEGVTETSLQQTMQTYESMMPKMDDIMKEYRGVSAATVNQEPL